MCPEDCTPETSNREKRHEVYRPVQGAHARRADALRRLPECSQTCTPQRELTWPGQLGNTANGLTGASRGQKASYASSILRKRKIEWQECSSKWLVHAIATHSGHSRISHNPHFCSGCKYGMESAEKYTKDKDVLRLPLPPHLGPGRPPRKVLHGRARCLATWRTTLDEGVPRTGNTKEDLG